jgi:ubiquinone/menaquinone biosynthesis C-methylase UbiE
MDRVRAYYAAFGDREWSRLGNPADGAIELELTQRALVRHLGGTERVLDVGGGPGRHAIWLAQRGHHVVLTDLSPEMLAIGRGHAASAGVALEDVTEADARDLSHWTDASFDAVLELGPFYHLQSLADRDLAAVEAARVLRPGGLLFAAFMPRLLFLRRTIAVPDEQHRLLERSWIEHLLRSGAFDNDVVGRFDHGYGARPEEIAPFLAKHGFDQLELIAAEGLTTGLQEVMSGLTDPALKSAVLDVIELTASEPSILGLASHLLYVGRKSAGHRTDQPLE